MLNDAPVTGCFAGCGSAAEATGPDGSLLCWECWERWRRFFVSCSSARAGGDDFDADELGLDPEEDFDA